MLLLFTLLLLMMFLVVQLHAIMNSTNIAALSGRNGCIIHISNANVGAHIH